MATGTIKNKPNNIGNYTDITSRQTFADRFVFPSEGYLELIQSGGNTNCRVYGENATSESDTRVTVKAPGNELTMVIYVRQGMQAYVYSFSGNGWARFYPLV